MAMNSNVNQTRNILNLVNIQNNFMNMQLSRIINGRKKFRRKYRVRKRIDPIREFDESEFKYRFRFSKREVREIYNLIDGPTTLDPMVRTNCVNYVDELKIIHVKCLKLSLNVLGLRCLELLN